MNQLTTEKRTAVVRCLVEGNSIRSTCRMTGIARNTVAKLLLDLADGCAKYHDEHVRGLDSKVIQCDEIWSFVGMKEKNVPREKLGEFGYGDVWLWTALDADSKLIVSYMLGMRDAESARDFMFDVADRLANRVQLTTDGHKVYLKAVREAFDNQIDYAMLVKTYGNDYSTPERTYSPAVCTGCKPTPIIGEPDEKLISTSYVERANLTLRMTNRRFTRLTNAFSKNIENHGAALHVHFMHYNFCRKHLTLKTTPAIAAGLTDRVWTVEDLIGLISN